eukprot:8917560-Karenia_brevis.AAC.1
MDGLGPYDSPDPCMDTGPSMAGLIYGTGTRRLTLIRASGIPQPLHMPKPIYATGPPDLGNHTGRGHIQAWVSMCTWAPICAWAQVWGWVHTQARAPTGLWPQQ